MLDLTRIDLATEEDKKYRIDYWASLFKATTWEELQMLAQNNDYFKEASETIYHLTQEEEIRLQCEAREDYYRTMNSLTHMLDKQKQALAEKDVLLSEKNALLSEKNTLLSEKNALLTEQNALLSEKNALLSEQNAQLSQKDSLLAEKDALIATLQAQLTAKE